MNESGVKFGWFLFHQPSLAANFSRCVIYPNTTGELQLLLYLTEKSRTSCLALNGAGSSKAVRKKTVNYSKRRLLTNCIFRRQSPSSLLLPDLVTTAVRVGSADVARYETQKPVKARSLKCSFSFQPKATWHPEIGWCKEQIQNEVSGVCSHELMVFQHGLSSGDGSFGLSTHSWCLSHVCMAL